MDRLRVLVLDDKPKNLDAARRQLGGICELTTEEDPHLGCGSFINYDVVLTDLMFPMPDIGRIGKYNDPTKEIPFGFLNMLGAIRVGVKYVALVTGSDPHEEPIAAVINEFCTRLGPVLLGDTRIVIDQQSDYGHYEKDWLQVFECLMKKTPFDYAQRTRRLLKLTE